MYSILIKIKSSVLRYKFLADENGNTLLFETIEEVEEKVKELLYTYTVSELEVVKRYEITNLIAIEEMLPDNEIEEEG